MRLTLLLFGRPCKPNTRPKVPPKERFFTQLPNFRISSVQSRRSWNCWRVSLSYVERALLYSALARHNRSLMTKRLRIARLEGALAPFGLEYPDLFNNLAKMNVLLNRKVLSEMAVWEPRTFKSITTLVQKQREIDGEASDKDRAMRLHPVDSVLGKNYLRS
ncbi:hypothetical protein RvY_17822 [Ramazzottius varieornatus]|uniref:39S ribosomal protein L20, mitochondrial n=1 Tax=Ramazzottius varieornatus TaxID=947166 RepID=A0A1D1W457_RAMVA|nr:hypothetical protein RvY_17822 [Ramazzottius varieornatus]